MKRRTFLNMEPLEGRSLLSGVSATLTTDASSYQAGQPVLITYTETNHSNRPAFIVAGPSVDVFVVQQNGATVWRSNEGMVPMYLRTDVLQPGQSFTIHAIWDGKENGDGAPLSGTFVVSNAFAPAAPPTTFQIAAPSGTNPQPPPTPTPTPIPTPVPPPIVFPPGPPIRHRRPVHPAPPGPIGPTHGFPHGPSHHHGRAPARQHVSILRNIHGHGHVYAPGPIVAAHRFSWIAPKHGRHHHGK